MSSMAATPFAGRQNSTHNTGLRKSPTWNATAHYGALRRTTAHCGATRGIALEGAGDPGHRDLADIVPSPLRPRFPQHALSGTPLLEVTVCFGPVVPSPQPLPGSARSQTSFAIPSVEPRRRMSSFRSLDQTRRRSAPNQGLSLARQRHEPSLQGAARSRGTRATGARKGPTKA
jgi:hypothetical protein